MGAKKVIEQIVDFLNLTNFTQRGKRKALKKLLKRLKERRLSILKKLQEECSAVEERQLREELGLLSFHIAKAKQKLASL